MQRAATETWDAPADRPAASGRYTLTAQALHWLTALLLLAILPLAWVAEAMPPGPGRGYVFTLHKSVGVTILVLAAARLAWRATHPAPALPDGTPRGLELVGRANHWLLYALLLLMPLTGYLMSSSGRPVSYFGLFDLPALPENRELARTANTLHLIGQWLVYALVALHVLGTAWHVAVRRDGLLGRMLPPQDNAALLPPQRAVRG